MADVTFTAYAFAATGAPTARTLPARLGNNVKNVKDWGATGDGSTDDLTAIQAAVNQFYGDVFHTNERGTVYFPPGTYFVSGPISVTGTSSAMSFSFRGEGPASKITGNFADGVLKKYDLAEPGPGLGPGYIEDLWINQDHTSGHGIYVGQGLEYAVRNCVITTKGHGIALPNVQGTTIANCDIVGTGSTTPRYGIGTSANGQITSTTVRGFTTGIALNQIGGLVADCTIKDNTDIGIACGQTAAYPSGGSTLTSYVIFGCNIANNGIGIDFPNGTGNAMISACSIVGGASSTYGVRARDNNPHNAVMCGCHVSGTFSVAGIKSGSQTSLKSSTAYIGVLSENSGAGVTWLRTDFPNVWSNVYIGCNNITPELWTFNRLPTAPIMAIGDTYSITDAETATWGASVVTGFSSNHVKVRWNGSNWTVVGK